MFKVITNFESLSAIVSNLPKEEAEMGITSRLIRIFKADIHGVMDQFEDKGLLLKQYLRDMEDALSDKETCLKKVIVACTLAQQEDENYGR